MLRKLSVRLCQISLFSQKELPSVHVLDVVSQVGRDKRFAGQ